MKYKNINSALHNFAQSFLGGLNFFEDDHIYHDVYKVVGKSKDKKFEINFDNGEVSQPELINSRIRKSIDHFQLIMPKHLKSHNIDPIAVSNIKLQIAKSEKGFDIYIFAIDNRGITHKVFVKPT